jgi:hypothetical protein
MSDTQRTTEGHQPTSVTGGGHPERVSKGWLPGSERGHQPVASAAEPTTGPASPSGVGSANTPAPSTPTPSPAPPAGE